MQVNIQACLLGINAIPLLGISVLQSDGKPVLSHVPSSPSEPEVAMVSLVESVTLPSQKGRVLKDRVCSPVPSCADLLFEPNYDLLIPLGVNSYEYVVTANGDGEVWLTVQNHWGITAHLETGMQLGTVRPTEVVALDSGPLPGGTDISCNAPVKAVECMPECLEQLCSELGLLDTLSSGEAAQLKALFS